MNLTELRQKAEVAVPLTARIYVPPFDQQIDLYWFSPYLQVEEKFAGILWPAHPIEKTEEAEKTFESTAEFIAAANPAVILALLDRVEAHEKALSKIASRCMLGWDDTQTCEPTCHQCRATEVLTRFEEK